MTSNRVRKAEDAQKKPVLGYVIVSVVLLGLLAFGLYGVQQYQTGRFAWMAHDETRLLNRIKRSLTPAQLPSEQDGVIQRMVPVHDNARSRFNEFGSELEQDCYLAFAGSICGFTREASAVKRKVENFINKEGTTTSDEQVLACAKGSQRFRDEMKALRTGRPHCNTVRDIVLSLKKDTQ